ncbi:metalloprotease [Salinibius halmophilus]|uniref:metalloprotease n=1 Tax=Salinibius halmophilus TaxID=1853216 RepID=UPI000E673EBA|nr:site-2 protease family protein [Salinibius halmophilus]
MLSPTLRTLATFELNGHQYEFCCNDFGKEILLREGVPVAGKRRLLTSGHFYFHCPQQGGCVFHWQLKTNVHLVEYKVTSFGVELLSGMGRYDINMPIWHRSRVQDLDNKASARAKQKAELASDAPNAKQSTNQTSKFSNIAIVGLVFTLFKSAGAMKAALAGTALAGWSWLFSFEFAIGLIIVLLIHEYGHIWAMRRAGLKVKGVFLIPFLGGVAVSERTKTNWQDFKIAIAGPFIGTLGAIVCWLLWLQTGNEFFALLSALGLLINIFNLLPIVPLDGGQVVKAAVFSLKSDVARYAMLALNAVLVVAAFYFGFSLLGFFGILGLVDLLFSSKKERNKHQPMSNTGIVMTGASYLGLIAVLVWLSIEMAATGVPGTDLPKIFLQS